MGTTYTVSSGNCPSFSCATSSSLLMLNAAQRGQFPRWRRSRKRLSMCSVLRCPDLWLQCSVSFVYGLEKTHHEYLLTLQTIIIILKHRICNGKCEAWNVTFPDDRRNETYQEESKQWCLLYILTIHVLKDLLQ